MKGQMKEEQVTEPEKELYSKECVAESIDFIVDEENKEVTGRTVHEKLSCDLATIFTRDKEVVAVKLEILSNGCEIYLSKNIAWLQSDDGYIDEIIYYLKAISENAPKILSNVERDFIKVVVSYCSAKLESIFKKLKNDIKNTNENYIRHIKSFKDFVSAKGHDVNNDKAMCQIFEICYDYYKVVKDDSSIPPKFLGHIKKAGSYIGSILNIIRYARNKKYISLFCNVKVYTGKSDIIKDQPIFSWKNIVKRFIDSDYEYEVFMDNCSKKSEVIERVRKVYTDEDTQQQQLLDGDDVKKYIYLHPAMKILAYIIDNNNNKNKKRVFIAVSNRCCYLCDLYIDFARGEKYNIIISKNNNKIYSGWKLPQVKDNDFKINSLKYILGYLNRIIVNKVIHYTSSLYEDYYHDDDIEGYFATMNSGGD